MHRMVCLSYGIYYEPVLYEKMELVGLKRMFKSVHLPQVLVLKHGAKGVFYQAINDGACMTLGT